MKSNIKILIITTLFWVSFKQDRERIIASLYKESSAIFIDATLNIMMKGYIINTDSLIYDYVRVTANNAESGLQCAQNLQNHYESLPKKKNVEDDLFKSNFHRSKQKSNKYYTTGSHLKFR